MDRYHLKGLDTYRGIAALIVLFCHIELFKDQFGYDNLLKHAFYKYTGGHTAVILFFVLSGFLITLLLLNGKNKFKKISLKNFYLRRIFRVWPLYYLIIIVSYLLIDYSPSSSTIVLCLTIFPNIAHALGAGWSISPQIWSIGVEEQFYIAWPFLVKNNNNMFKVSLFIFVFLTILPHGLLFTLNRIYPDPTLMTLINKIFFGTKFNCMAFGGFVAVIYNEKKSFINLLNRNIFISYSLTILPFFLWLSGYHLNLFQDELYSVLFAISILILTTNTKIINIDNPISKYFGKISYGIYMYHWIILELLFRNKILNIENNQIFNISIYSITIGLTLSISTFSYYFIEKPFLKIKEKYSR